MTRMFIAWCSLKCGPGVAVVVSSPTVWHLFSVGSSFVDKVHVWKAWARRRLR